MLFNSIEFIIFFPIVVMLYFALPKKISYIWLLIASYYFYMKWNPVYILLLFGVTLVTYITALKIEGLGKLEKAGKKKKNVIFLCIFVSLAILFYFKYFEFGLTYVNKSLEILGIRPLEWNGSIVLPVGISFYILQSLGYVIDVYREEIRAERNFLRYALFISFFPQLVAGPIERSKNLLQQLQLPPKFSFENLKNGYLLMLWGFFVKMVISDRLAFFVDTVYGDLEKYTGIYIIVATFMFAIQIYCDFYGYSTIARGAALILGIHLMDNFEAPYFSKNVKEFWRRWHISLSGWFRDYLYIPLGGNRKGIFRKRCNLLVVMGVSGLWHGASMSFIFWGLLNGIYQVVSDIMVPWKKKADSFMSGRIWLFVRSCVQVIVVFCMISITWLFFRAGNMETAIYAIKQMGKIDYSIFSDYALYRLGISKGLFVILFIAIILLGIVDYLKYKGIDVLKLVQGKNYIIRLAVHIVLIFSILLFGCYGAGYDSNAFIYFQF